MSAEVTDADRDRLTDALAIELESLGLSGEVSARAADYLADTALHVLADQRAAADDGHEWCCPSCGATTRARMADRDDDGLRARVEALADVLRENGDRRMRKAREPGSLLANQNRSGALVYLAAADMLRAALDPPTAAPCPARHTVTGDGGVPAQWSCQVLGEHDEHQDSTGRVWA